MLFAIRARRFWPGLLGRLGRCCAGGFGIVVGFKHSSSLNVSTAANGIGLTYVQLLKTNRSPKVHVYQLVAS